MAEPPTHEELDRVFRYLAMGMVKALSIIQTPPNPQSSDVVEIEYLLWNPTIFIQYQGGA